MIAHLSPFILLIFSLLHTHTLSHLHLHPFLSTSADSELQLIHQWRYNQRRNFSTLLRCSLPTNVSSSLISSVFLRNVLVVGESLLLETSLRFPLFHRRSKLSLMLNVLIAIILLLLQNPPLLIHWTSRYINIILYFLSFRNIYV